MDPFPVDAFELEVALAAAEEAEPAIVADEEIGPAADTAEFRDGELICGA